MEVRLKHAKVTKHPLGYGFVEMADSGSANQCIQNLDGFFLKDKVISVRWASRNKKLFFTNLGRSTNLSNVITLCQRYGSVCPERSMINRSESGNVYAVVEFDEREAAEAARLALNGSLLRLSENHHTTIFVNWEQSISTRSRSSRPMDAPFPYFSVHISFRSSVVCHSTFSRPYNVTHRVIFISLRK
jgi:RNA recognition motif-containing protein